MDNVSIQTIQSIYQRGLSGKVELSNLASEWPPSESPTVALLYDELEDAVVHAPAKGFFSKSIDFEKWETMPEFCKAYFNFLTLERFFSDSKWLEKRNSALGNLKVFSKFEIENLIKNLN